MAWLILISLATTVILVRSRYWPRGPCPWCTRKGRGKSGRGFGSTDKAFNSCGHCGGKGERIRPLARIWPRHRETARQLKEARNRR